MVKFVESFLRVQLRHDGTSSHPVPGAFMPLSGTGPMSRHFAASARISRIGAQKKNT
jgi:hypothetical protein